MSTMAVQLQNLHKTYRRTWGRGAHPAVIDVSLGISEGEAFGFVGPNGAGKSTTIKMLVGGIRASSGMAYLFGKDIRDPASRVGLGYVPENPSLSDYLTPLEVLSIGMSLHQTRVDSPHSHRMHWLERFELGAVANKPIRTFSKGMAQRVALAHAMAIKPRLLILDEPLSGLDPVGRKDVVDILFDYHRQGGTLFFSSHVLHDVENLADHFGLIHKGRLLTVRSPQELLKERADQFVVSFHSDAPWPQATMVRPGQYEIPAAQDEIPALLETLRAAGARLLGVRHAVSLETAFLDMVRRDDRSVGDRKSQ